MVDAPPTSRCCDGGGVDISSSDQLVALKAPVIVSPQVASSNVGTDPVKDARSCVSLGERLRERLP